MRLKHAILPAYLLCLLLVGGFIAYQFREKPNEEGDVGASIPTIIALYEDSLATKITSSATSFTLVRGTDKQSRSLAGFYGFVIDENTSKEEFMTANCTATACTIVARGIDVQDGKTEVSGNKFEHARNASVKLTNFPQLAILSRILNGQESASSTFSFGDGTTGDNKTLFVDNGSANKPFLRYNETSDLWTFSDNGTDTVVLNTLTSGGLTASSSLGVIITDSKIGVNASSTGGMSFDSAGKLYFNGSVNVPMTVGFPAIFNGNVTTTGHLQVATPTADLDAVSKVYADSNISLSTATGTAEIAITAGQGIWISPTSSRLMPTDTTYTTSTFHFLGIASESVSAGATISYSKSGGINCNQTGLTPGLAYFLNGTSGQVSSTPATNIARVGIATSDSCIQVLQPKFLKAGTATIDGTGTTDIATGFYPAKIKIIAGAQSQSALGYDSFSVSNEGGTLTQSYDGTRYVTAVGSANGYSVSGLAASQTGTISARNPYGFTISNTEGGTAGSIIIAWEAESL